MVVSPCLLAVTVILAAEPSEGNVTPQGVFPAPQAPKASLAGPPALHELQNRLSDLLKREAQAKDGPSRAAATRALCELHQQIVSDPRYAASDVLKEYRARLWSRLTKIKAEIKQQLAREGRRNPDALADVAAIEAADPALLAAADSLGLSLGLLDHAGGGPGALLSYGGRAGLFDYGPDLVALIERTINPAFWDVAGGPGTIVYYAPLQCLVVRATSEVHGRVGGLLGDLRAVGK